MASPNIWFTADLHLDHTACIRHCGRPFATIDSMNEHIVNSWNACVSEKDTVFIIGDFAWKRHGHWLHELRGRKIMVFGNHDKMKLEHQRCFSKVYGDPKNPGIHQNTLGGKYMAMCHYPLHTWNGRWHKSVAVSGHCHGRYRAALPGETYGGSIIDVGWDVHHKLLELPEVIKFLDDKLDILAQPLTRSQKIMRHLKAAWRELCAPDVSHAKAMDEGYEIDYAGEPVVDEEKGFVPLADVLVDVRQPDRIKYDLSHDIIEKLEAAQAAAANSKLHFP